MVGCNSNYIGNKYFDEFKIYKQMYDKTCFGYSGWPN